MASDAKDRQHPADGRIHVVHVVTSLEPGGLENGVVNLANSLDPGRFRSSIVCLERVGEFRARLDSRTVVDCLDKPPGFHWRSGLRLGALLDRLGADVIHTHNLGPLIYGVIARRFGGCRGTLVQGEHAELRADEKVFRRRWIRRIAYRSCAAVHAVSAGLRRELIDFGLPAEKIRVILNGVDCGRFEPATPEVSGRWRRDHAIPESAFVIGMVGRFGASKRHDLLIGGFEKLAGRFPDLHLLLVGDHGPEKESILARCERSRFRDRILRAGFQIDPVPFFQMTDLLVIPSDNEGLSNVMLEAMACGVPCLAHPACGAGEVIRDGENGFLRPMTDAEQLARELGNLLETGAVEDALREQARRTALTQFSLEAMIRGYERLYEEVRTGF